MGLILFLLSIYLANIKAWQIEGQFTDTFLEFVAPSKSSLHFEENLRQYSVVNFTNNGFQMVKW